MPAECPAIFAAISPDLCTAVDRYCERTSAAIDAEPINALTNLAFLIAAWAAWRLHRRAPRSEADGLISVLIANIALVGLGSFAFHTIATNWARWLDVGPVVLFMLLYLWFVVTHLLAWPRWIRFAALVVYGGLTLGLDDGGAGGQLAGGAKYLPSIAVMLGIGVLLFRANPAAGRAFAVAAGVFVLAFAARTLDMPLCEAWPLGTHFAWHLLNAVVIYLLVRLAILYSKRPA